MKPFLPWMCLHCVRLHPDAVLPKKAHPGDDAGFDLTPISVEARNGCVIYGFGLSVHIPVNHVGLLFPRSSVWKTGLGLANSVGVIDHGYSGEVKAIFRCFDGHPENYQVGTTPVAQLVVIPISHMHDARWEKEAPESSRGVGGFGSTDKQ